MKVLIWADRSQYVQELAKKLKREHHELYFIYDEAQERPNSVKRSHEEYCLNYQSDHILTVLQNLSPDICLFMIDPAQIFRRNQSYAEYVAGLANAVLSSKQAGVKSFLYRSSSRIYSENTAVVISDATFSAGDSELVQNLMACESLLSTYSSASFRTVALRMAEVYSCEPFREEFNVVNSFIAAAGSMQPVTYSADNCVSAIHYKDACDAVYRVMLNVDSAPPTVLITPESSSTEQEIVDSMKGVVEFSTATCTRTTEAAKYKYRHQFLDSVGYQQKYSLEEGMKDIFTHVHPASKEKQEKKKLRMHRPLIQLLEIIVAFLLVHFFVLATSEAHFHDIIDVYMLLVLTVSVTYGGMKGLFAAILCMIGRTFSGQDSLLLAGTDYYYWGLQLLMVTALGGFLKDKYKRMTIDLEDENQYLDQELAYYKQLNQNGQAVKDIYETRLLNYENSFGKISDVVSSLDTLEPQQVIFEAVHTVGRVMNSKGVCIYTLNGFSPFARLLASTDGKIWPLGKSFSTEDYPQMMSVLNDGQVFVNSDMNTTLPVMASAIRKDGVIRQIIMIYQMDFEDLNLSQAHTLETLTGMVDKSMNRAFEYYDEVHDKRYCGETRVMKWDEFKKIIDLYCSGEAEHLLVYTLIRVTGLNMADEKYQRLVRDTDYLGECGENQYYILLTNTSSDDCATVIQRLVENHAVAQICRKEKGKTRSEVFPNLL